MVLHACVALDKVKVRLEARVRHIDGFPEPTWEEVTATQADWEAWPDQRLLLDSINPLDINVQRVLQHVSNRTP